MPTRADLLIVEDNALILQSVLRFLASRRLAVLTAPNGDEALGQLDDLTGLGALITDIRMPGAVNGVTLALAARRRFPGLPVLLITGFAPPDDLERALGADCRLLLKPFRPRRLLEEVDAMLGRDHTDQVAPGQAEAIARPA